MNSRFPRKRSSRRVLFRSEMAQRVASKFLQSEYQSSIPTDSKLAHKLGITPGAKILFFASYWGDWAKAVSEFAQVTSLDISEKALAYSLMHNRGKIRTFLKLNAARYPRKTELYDWSVSYEPYPLKKPNDNAHLRVALIRALLNRKGAKIIIGYATEKSLGNHTLVRAVRRIAKEFGATEKTTFETIAAKESPESSIELTPCAISTLETNPSARAKALTYLAKSQR